MIEKDPKRTGVKAREIYVWPEPCDEYAIFRGQPGDMIRTGSRGDAREGFLIACPGCGQFGAITLHLESKVHWKVTGGTSSDVTTLSLSPSILKHCCGWHGYLTDGVFASC